MARAGVAPVATAADLVCGAFTPRHVAVCVFGAPIVPAAASATLASLARNVVAPLGRIHHTATLLVNVTVDDGHEREVGRKLLHEHFDGHQSLHAHVGLTSTIPPLSSCTSGSRTSHHHHADSSIEASRSVRFTDVQLRLLDSRRQCYDEVLRREAVRRMPFDEILILPTNHLWTRPLWPLCFHSLPASNSSASAPSIRGVARRHRHVWWMRRDAAYAALVAPSECVRHAHV